MSFATCYRAVHIFSFYSFDQSQNMCLTHESLIYYWNIIFRGAKDLITRGRHWSNRLHLPIEFKWAECLLATVHSKYFCYSLDGAMWFILKHGSYYRIIEAIGLLLSSLFPASNRSYKECRGNYVRPKVYSFAVFDTRGLRTLCSKISAKTLVPKPQNCKVLELHYILSGYYKVQLSTDSLKRRSYFPFLT